MGNLPTQLTVGSVITSSSASYRIGRSIGSGGFGQTYLALDMRSHGFVAVKEYFPKRCTPQRLPDATVRPTGSMASMYYEGMKSFLKEATMLAALRDIDSIVHVTDYFEAYGTAYMVMDYVIGETLRDCIINRGPMAYAMIEKPMLALMRDVDTINGAGVVHRDINPANVILTPGGRLRLIDFGCARSMEDGRSMEVMLTPGFAPTEQYSRHGQGPFTDVYALCATLYYCLTGEVPPSSSDRANAVYQGAPDPLALPSQLGVSLPDGVEDVLMRGLSIFSQHRTQTMGRLADELEEARRPRPVVPQPRPEPKPEPTAPEPQEEEHESWLRRWGVTVLVAIAVVAGIAFVASATMCSMGAG